MKSFSMKKRYWVLIIVYLLPVAANIVGYLVVMLYEWQSKGYVNDSFQEAVSEGFAEVLFFLILIFFLLIQFLLCAFYLAMYAKRGNTVEIVLAATGMVPLGLMISWILL